MIKRWGIFIFFAAVIFFTSYVMAHAAVTASQTEYDFIKNNPKIVDYVIRFMAGVISILFVVTVNRYNKSIDIINTNQGKLFVEVGHIGKDVAKIKGKLGIE